MAGLEKITWATETVVTLPEAKNFLRVDHDDEDLLISRILTAAQEYCEVFQNRTYLPTGYQYWLDGVPGEMVIWLPRPPVVSVDSVKVFDVDGGEHVLPPGSFDVDIISEPGRVLLREIPAVEPREFNTIVVEYTAGYQDPSKIPSRVRHAILLLTAHWYQNREAVLVGTVSKEIEFAVTALLWQERVLPL